MFNRPFPGWKFPSKESNPQPSSSMLMPTLPGVFVSLIQTWDALECLATLLMLSRILLHSSFFISLLL
jgi:hypothetical protein